MSQIKRLFFPSINKFPLPLPASRDICSSEKSLHHREIPPTVCPAVLSACFDLHLLYFSLDYASQTLSLDVVAVPGVFRLRNAVNLLLLFVLRIPVCYGYLFCYRRGNPTGLLSNAACDWSGNEQLGTSAVLEVNA